MNKKSSRQSLIRAASALPPDAGEPMLLELRDKIDALDKVIVEALNDRMFYAILIGRIKRAAGQPTYSPSREKDIASKIKGYNREPLRDDALIRIFERIIDEARAIQNEETLKGEIFLKDE